MISLWYSPQLQARFEPVVISVIYDYGMLFKGTLALLLQCWTTETYYEVSILSLNTNSGVLGRNTLLLLASFHQGWEKPTSRVEHLEKLCLKFVAWNPCYVSLTLSIPFPLWFIIIPLVFFYLSKLLLSGFLQFKGNLVCGPNTQNSVTELYQLMLINLWTYDSLTLLHVE